MPKKPIVVEKWEYHALTPDRWDDFEQLFGPNGACAGCWCAWFLMNNKEFTTARKEGHKELMRTLVQSGVEPGIIAYADGNTGGLGGTGAARELQTPGYLQAPGSGG